MRGTFELRFKVFPSRGNRIYVVESWPAGVAGGRAVPPDVHEELERAQKSTPHH